MPRPKSDNPKILVAGRVEPDIKQKLELVLAKRNLKESRYVREVITAAVLRDIRKVA